MASLLDPLTHSPTVARDILLMTVSFFPEKRKRLEIEGLGEKLKYSTDKLILTQFSALIDRVATWSLPFAQHEHISMSDLPQMPNDDLRRVAPVAKDLLRFLQSPKEVRLFVRGFVSLAITEMLIRTLLSDGFSGPTTVDLWVNPQLAEALNIVEWYLFISGKC